MSATVKSEKVMSYKAMKRREMWTAYAFILPTYIGFIIFIIGPMLMSFAISLFDWNLLTPPKFSGLSNFQHLLADPRIGNVYLTTFKLALMIVPANMALGLGLAVLLDRKMPGLIRNFFKTSYFFPFVVSAVAVSIIWTFMFHRDLGPLNYYLGFLGIERINWLNSSTWSPFAIMIADVWRNVGFYVLVFLGGMQAIPRDFYEAAEVDGAGVWRQFRHITLPLLSPTVLFLAVISVIGALQIFEQPQILTGGGPGDATRTIVLYLYEQGFKFFNMGYASAIAISLFAIILVFTGLQLRLSRRWVFY